MYCNLQRNWCPIYQIGDGQLLASPAQRYSALLYAPAIISKVLAGALGLKPFINFFISDPSIILAFVARLCGSQPKYFCL